MSGEADGTATTRALIYTRTAESSQTRLARQREACLAECRRRGWRVVGEYTDDGASGWRPYPGLGRALAALSAGTADVLMVCDLARGGRNAADLQRLIDAGLPIVSATGRAEASPPSPMESSR